MENANAYDSIYNPRAKTENVHCFGAYFNPYKDFKSLHPLFS